MGKRKKSDKSSLGRDPFEDMNGMGREEDELVPEPDQEEDELILSKDEEIAPEQDVAEAEPPTEEETELVLSTDKGPAPEQTVAKVEPPAEEEAVKTALEADLESEEAETEPVESAADAEAEKVEPPAEVEAVSAPSAPPRSRVLDDLMDTIDQEVEEAFGPGAMADLAPAKVVGAGGEEQHVIFTLAGTEYAVSIANVTEIGRPLDVTPVPNVPDWVLGVVNLRGDIISMVDLRAFLGMEWIGYQQTSRMVVAQARQEEMTAGLIVDRVNEIRYLAVDRIGAPTAAIEDQVAPYLRGVYEHDGRLLVVLDFDRLLLSPKMRQFEPV